MLSASPIASHVPVATLNVDCIDPTILVDNVPAFGSERRNTTLIVDESISDTRICFKTYGVSSV